MNRIDNKPYVSIIIPTYNRASMLEKTIESFVGQDYPRDHFELVVADNNSTDTTKQIILDWQHRTEVLIKYILESRQGVHYARNAAAKIAKGDILYYTDDDMIADKDLLREIVKVFDYDQNIGSATGKIIGRFEIEPPTWVRKHLINSYLSLTEETRKEDIIITPVDLVYSCHQAIRRDAFFKCGGFNPENTAGLWIGDGETGLGIKLAKAGYKFAYTSKSIIYHTIPPSRMTLSYLVKRIGNQGYSDSYTAYRRHRDVKRILPKIVSRSTFGIVKMIIETIKRILRRNESWHFIPARIAYFYKMNAYDLMLLRDAEFRRVVEIDDWLINDAAINLKLK